MKTHIIVLALIMLVAPVSAQAGQANAGITPDSPLWALEIATERFMEMLAMNGDTRTALQLKHADERIAEMQVATNKEKAMEQYNNVLSRIDSKNLNYNTSEMIRTRMMQHTTTLATIEGTDEIIQKGAKLRTATIDSENTIKNNELLWWGGFIAEQGITSMDSSILLMYNIKMEDVHEFIPGGITQITITQRDGSIVNNYVIKHTETDITIQEGVTTNSAQSYTFKIADVMEYEQKYGWVIGHEN